MRFLGMTILAGLIAVILGVSLDWSHVFLGICGLGLFGDAAMLGWLYEGPRRFIHRLRLRKALR
jgi:hypothetical protein